MLWKRVSASAHNCALIIVGSLPLLPVLGRENWRVALVAICFVYHWIFRRDCPGNYIAGIHNVRPLGLHYCALYSGGFATCFWSIAIPFDILALYVLFQWLCLYATNQTIPGYLAGYKPCCTSGATIAFTEPTAAVPGHFAKPSMQCG